MMTESQLQALAGAIRSSTDAEVVAALDSVVLHAPIHVGDGVLTDVCGTGADIVTCRDMA